MCVCCVRLAFGVRSIVLFACLLRLKSPPDYFLVPLCRRRRTVPLPHHQRWTAKSRSSRRCSRATVPHSPIHRAMAFFSSFPLPSPLFPSLLFRSPFLQMHELAKLLSPHLTRSSLRQQTSRYRLSLLIARVLSLVSQAEPPQTIIDMLVAAVKDTSADVAGQALAVALLIASLFPSVRCCTPSLSHAFFLSFPFPFPFSFSSSRFTAVSKECTRVRRCCFIASRKYPDGHQGTRDYPDSSCRADDKAEHSRTKDDRRFPDHCHSESQGICMTVTCF